MKVRVAIAAAAIAAVSAMPVTPARASSHDCTIMGPDYVSEAVDCAIYILERAIQW